jgi:exosortase
MLTLSKRHLILLFLTSISLVIWWRPLAATFRLALEREEYTHILLVFPVSVALMAQEWRIRKPSSEPSIRLGMLLLALSVLLGLFARVQRLGLPADGRRSLAMVAFVTWWIGAFALVLGSRICRSLIFPLGFLFWLVPFPDFVLGKVVALLQQGSSFAADLLFAAAGVPVTRDGAMLSIPGLTLEVAKECSSIRSSLMLVVTTMVLAQLLLRSAWRKTLVVAVAVPLSVAKNGLRIFTIAMLGTRVDRGFLTGNLHHHGGVVFFLIALAGVFLLLWALRRTEGQIVPVRALDPVRS